ncbi:MAG: thioredoxin family protein [Methyloligellaceae bacterium]
MFKSLYIIAIVSLVGLSGFAEARDMRLIVFEADECSYCDLFHRDVAQSYTESWPGRVAPLERQKVTANQGAEFQLKQPITTVPTFVLVDGTNEIVRITGYPGRQNFFQVITGLLQELR